MITYYDGNIFDSDAKIICHQVNTYGVMGAGIAAEVKERFPEVYTEYNAFCAANDQDMLLGAVLFSPTQNGFIANCFSQKGMDTHYDAFDHCMRMVKEFAEEHDDAKIAIPYKMGCGIAGGDWHTVEQIINRVFDGSDLEVEIWKLV